MMVDCVRCHNSYQIDADNTDLFEYEDEPWLNLAFSECTTCHMELRLFTLEWWDDLVETGCEVIKAHGTLELRHMFRDTMGIKSQTEHDVAQMHHDLHDVEYINQFKWEAP